MARRPVRREVGGPRSGGTCATIRRTTGLVAPHWVRLQRRDEEGNEGKFSHHAHNFFAHTVI